MTTTAIKFFWNGIKVNGGSLIKCWFHLYDNERDGESVRISAKGYGAQLPGDVFAVTNDTDSYTDYFDTDSATLTPAHPLYKYAKAAAIKSDLRYSVPRLASLEAEQASGHVAPWRVRGLGAEIDGLRAKIEKFNSTLAVLPSGQPTAADLAEVEELNTAAETARIAREHAEQLAEREKVLNARSEGRRYIESVAQAHPIVTGAPVVTICWSEHPAFYSWSEEDPLQLSVAAAEIVLKHYDEQRAAENAADDCGGYDKTSFSIEYAGEDGKPCSYEGRYDLGDDEGGLIAHIRNFGASGYGLTAEERAEYAAFADMLEEHTAGGRVVKIELAPWVAEYQQRKAEQDRAEMQEILDEVETWDADQLETAVMLTDPASEEQHAVAGFFLRQLQKIDPVRARRTFMRWINGGAA